MRLHAFGAELLLDEFGVEEFPSELQQIVFITSLVNIKIKILPDILPKVYTSETLKAQLIILYQSQEKLLDETTFHVLTAYEATRIQVDAENSFEVLPLMPADVSTSFMLAFRKIPSLRISHLYAGFATNLSAIMVNTKFAIWLRASDDSIDNLYVLNLPYERCNDCENASVFEDIQQKVNDENIAKLLVHLPLFGSEVITAHLASKYRGIVAIDGLLCDIFSKVQNVKMEYFTEDFVEAAIVVSMNDLSLEPDCTVQILMQKSKLNWLPLPDAFELKLFERLVAPKSIENIDINTILESFAIYVTKYTYQKNAMEEENIANSSSTNSIGCHCSKIKTPFERSTVNHASLEDCMQHLVFAYTDQYQNPQQNDNLEDELDRMFKSESISTATESARPQQRTETVTSTSDHREAVEQPTTSKAAKETDNSTALTNIQTQIKKSPGLAEKLAAAKSIPTTNLIYRRGKKGVHFEDSSSSSD